MYSFLSYFTHFLSWTSHLQTPFQTQQTSSSVLSSLPTIIPGSTAFTFCNTSRTTDLYSVERVDVLPWPPHVDDQFTIHTYGTFLKDITDNATIRVDAAYNYGDSLGGDESGFCESTESIEQPDPGRKEKCPPEKGFALMTWVAWCPPMLGFVEGNWTIKFDAKTKEGEQIFCLEANFYLECTERSPDWACFNRTNKNTKVNM